MLLNILMERKIIYFKRKKLSLTQNHTNLINHRYRKWIRSEVEKCKMDMAKIRNILGIKKNIFQIPILKNHC